MIANEEGLVAIATSYFRSLFESSNPQENNEALSNISTTITGSNNERLTAHGTEW